MINKYLRAYETFVQESGFIPLTDDAYSVIGLCGESGECAEWVKKAQFRKNKKYTPEMLKLELGDVIHYVTRLALNHGWTLREVMDGNVTKLEARRAKDKVKKNGRA
jgi:NTP pyrophosphatase (non-canonical NTP hydrolase)